MKILVTGGAGFIGSHLVEALTLLNPRPQITVVDNFSTGKLENLDGFKDKIKIIRQDISDFGTLNPRVFKDEVDVVVHLAALARMQRSINDPVETHIANVNGTLNMLDFARKAGVKKFVYASSSSVYGNQEELPVTEDLVPNPENPYATQKLIGEHYCKIYRKVYGLDTTALRFFNVYGTRMTLEGEYKLVFGNWIEQIKANKPIGIFGDGEQTRDFTHVNDVVRAILSAINPDPFGFQAYNVCSGIETSVNQLADMFEPKYGVTNLPARAGEEKRKYGSYDRIMTMLGWQPHMDLESGVKELRKYYEI